MVRAQVARGTSLPEGPTAHTFGPAPQNYEKTLQSVVPALSVNWVTGFVVCAEHPLRWTKI